MKTTMLILALSFSLTAFSQRGNTDKIEKTVTTRTTVKSSLGEEVKVKKEKVSAAQELVVEKDGTTNQGVRYKPVKVSKKTVFESGGEQFEITPDPKGYSITILKNGNKKSYGKIRKMSRPNAYLLITDEGNAFGYFNQKGDFIVESYDAKNDKISVETFAISKADLND
jgi:hypothetical protein